MGPGWWMGEPGFVFQPWVDLYLGVCVCARACAVHQASLWSREGFGLLQGSLAKQLDPAASSLHIYLCRVHICARATYLAWALDCRAAAMADDIPALQTFKPGDLAQAFFDLPGLAERGAGGRIVVAPGKLTRGDLHHNYDVVLTAIKFLGSKPSVDGLTGWNMTDEVFEFFSLARPRGKPSVNRAMSACTMQLMYSLIMHVICRVGN